MPQQPTLTPKLVVHHVGARGYGVSFYLPQRFRGDLVHVLYEADAEAVDRMLQDKGGALSEALEERHVFPYCLGRRAGKATLNITANSYVSSLFAPNADFAKYYCEIPIDTARYDVTYGEMLKVVRKVDVELHSLDELFASGRIPVTAVPDLLSLDTQGYELEILEGAVQTLSRGGLALLCEVEMLPMYLAQPLFGDIFNFARRQGFVFAGFTTLFDVSPHRAPVGLRGRGLPGFGDALFLRDLEWFDGQRLEPDARYLMLRKLAFLAICLGYVEYGLEAAARAAKVEQQASAALRRAVDESAYGKFLREIEEIARVQEPRFLPVHSVPDDSRQAGDDRTSWYDKYHRTALNRVILKDIITVLGRTRLGRALRAAVPDRGLSAIRRFVGLSSAEARDSSAFEDLLESNGFIEVAGLVRQRRIAAESYLRALAGDMLAAGQAAHLPRE
jgi:FkbM family methyltransferase